MSESSLVGSGGRTVSGPCAYVDRGTILGRGHSLSSDSTFLTVSSSDLVRFGGILAVLIDFYFVLAHPLTRFLHVLELILIFYISLFFSCACLFSPTPVTPLRIHSFALLFSNSFPAPFLSFSFFSSWTVHRLPLILSILTVLKST